jgi:hypothetical protein
MKKLLLGRVTDFEFAAFGCCRVFTDAWLLDAEIS